MKWKRRLLWTAIATAALVAAVFILDSIFVWLWDGSYDLVVEMETAQPRKVVHAWYSGDHQRKELQYFRQHELQGNSAEWSAVGNFNGRQLSVRMSCGGRTTQLLGRETDYGEFDLALFKFELDNGETLYKIVEVPPGRGRRTVAVQIP
jgi:hypothetical protein